MIKGVMLIQSRENAIPKAMLLFSHYVNVNMNVKLLSRVWLSANPWTIAYRCVQLCSLVDCRTPDFPVLHHLLEFVHIHVH